MKNDRVRLKEVLEVGIVNLGVNGEGIARVEKINAKGQPEKMVVFVPGALPGEKVLAEVNLVKKNYAMARLVRVLSRSPMRIWPRCGVYQQCGGCQLQHMEYSAQLAMKEQQVRDALQRIGHVSGEVMPILGAKEPWGYRNKMQFPVGQQKSKILIGCYERQTHGVVNTLECLIQDAANNQVLQAVRQWMERYKIAAYNEKTGRGLVRHVMARSGREDQVMAVLITKQEELPHAGELVELLVQKVPGLRSLVQNINEGTNNIVMGKKSRVLWGEEYILAKLGDLQFKVSAESFFQVNTAQAEALYAQVKDFAALQGGETVADLYCGTGTIALYLAGQAGKVYGIEIVAAAIANARQNAADNGIKNAEFICGDAVQELPKLLARGIKLDVVVLDPPRGGCEEPVLKAVMDNEPQKILYVSCNPATLARDLGYLSSQYQVRKVQPVDMFPQTVHVESVVWLEKK